MIQLVEHARTKWKRVSNLRLRPCIGCTHVFPSAGAEERRCIKCTKKLDDARARAFTDSPEQKTKEELEAIFDLDIAAKRVRNAKHDSERRILRRNLAGE